MWVFLAVFALVLLFAPRPDPQTQPPAAIEDLNVPTAKAGKEIPVVFGCVTCRDPNVVWYGDLRTTPIKSKGGKK